MEKQNILMTLMAVILIVLIVLAAFVARPGPDPGPFTGGRATRDAPRDVRWGGPATCYPKEMVTACQKFVRNTIRESRRFGPASADETDRLIAEAERLSRKYGVQVSGGQLVAMRDMEVALEARSGGARALRYGPKLLTASQSGEPVVAIAERFRLPPMAALRQILLELGYSSAATRAMIADPTRLPARLAREAQAIFEADLGSRLNADRIRTRSQAYEDALGAHLRRLGLQFQTEDDLRRAYEASDGQTPLLTPDFLLSEPVRIDGKPVHWIDAKDYPMYGSRLVARSLASQAAKYTDTFGPGAMIFSGGLMCDAHVLPKSADDPPLLLDGSHVNLRRTHT